MKTKIYLLLDMDGAIKYVGKTKHELDYRLNQHIREAKSKTHIYSYRYNWLRKRLLQGYIPALHLLEEVDGNGNPTAITGNSPVALTEKGEVSYNGYVFSDTIEYKK